MPTRALAIASVQFKAWIRAATNSTSTLDAGDLLLICLIFFAIPPTGEIDVLELPGAAGIYLAILAAVLLYLLGRALSGALALERRGKLKGVSPGGAAYSLRNLDTGLARLASIPYCFAGALLEEIAFRHFVYSWLSDAFGSRTAIILQAVVFAAVHAVPALMLRHGRKIACYAAVFPFVSGLLLQRLYLASGGVAAPSMVHWVLNAGAVWRANGRTGKVYYDAH